jgi:acyl-CoA thioester hydrolase
MSYVCIILDGTLNGDLFTRFHDTNLIFVLQICTFFYQKTDFMLINFINLSKVRVRYGETDQMGYCYYGNYAQFCEVGRVEALRAIGMPYSALEREGIMLPVTKYEIEFKYPAKYDDLLEIKTNLTGIKGPQIYFDYEISCGPNIIATAFTSLVFVDKSSMKPIRPPHSFLDLIHPYLTR